jgi:hypothetical protein
MPRTSGGNRRECHLNTDWIVKIAFTKTVDTSHHRQGRSESKTRRPYTLKDAISSVTNFGTGSTTSNSLLTFLPTNVLLFASSS